MHSEGAGDGGLGDACGHASPGPLEVGVGQGAGAAAVGAARPGGGDALVVVCLAWRLGAVVVGAGVAALGAATPGWDACLVGRPG